MTRAVHYINQFFAGIGGEDHAGAGPEVKQGAHGPGRLLQQLIPEEIEIAATVFCGDDYAAATRGATQEILELIQQQKPELVITGPAFTSGRYGLACARVAAAAKKSGIPVVAAMHEDNPGVDEAEGAPVVASGRAARTMKQSVEALAAAVAKVAAGEVLGRSDGRIGKLPRRNQTVDATAAQRAVKLVLTRLDGNKDATEVPLPRFDRVEPAAPIQDLSQTTVAVLTEGALVPNGNPDNLESARATRWLRYSIDGVDRLDPDHYQSVHGGFSTQWANEDPNRILPLDAARELEREGVIGKLHSEYFVTAGNGTSVANARRFGIEWAAELRRAGVQAIVMTST